MAVGIVVVLASLDSIQSLGPAAIAVLLTAAGFMLLFGPWVWGLFEELTDERRAESARRNGPTWQPICTTQSFRRWP